MVAVVICSGATVVVNVTLEREDEIAGPILAPFFPQVTSSVLCFALMKATAIDIGRNSRRMQCANNNLGHQRGTAQCYVLFAKFLYVKSTRELKRSVKSSPSVTAMVIWSSTVNEV